MKKPNQKITFILFIRSLAFNFVFFAWAFISSILFIPFFILSSKAAQKIGSAWAKPCLFFAHIFCGIKYEVRGRENIQTPPHNPAVIYASKHQSAWDTIIFLTLLPNMAYVLKKELLRLPFWGWYLWRMKMIAVDRGAGASSIKQLVRDGKMALSGSRPIVIFPEGTRTKPNASPDYHAGITAMYSTLNVPVVPVALNSGVYWGKNAFFKKSGTIIIEFLSPIPAGLSKKEFAERLQHDIETASNQLIQESEK
jgi:1-acyl-sn-glycerol-3-phosphate acyltransferase